ncbi:S1C family serine protease [Halobacterium jilantaiense]|uniref:Serine protease, S1-C subfamily, contains C-terminal PDZ domain n=1 Tax=Halobacterium jilantaiense TaxID=355548 RepID=A0A1I0QEL1_9EURY|nr:trypsin-like peptidase domain-containing protein [Halobacterium jilantaiense]SEW25498.1 serine protease, S1-C subfamily, contains C-terminal PDZ domain [Halobacterium jilantaiense]
MRREYLVVGVALLLVTAGFGVVSAQSPAAVGGATGAQSADTTQQAQQASCDYAALYDQTIDSVVGVRTSSGQGSGFVYQGASGDDASYVVTNAHVVGDANSVTIQFSNEASSTGEVVGTDAIADLAVVRVADVPSGVEALSVASSTPDPGEKVAAIGSPFGLDETITHGIVSGVNRSLPTGQNAAVPTVLQTDAPINPGNSGGPLVTCDGTVVGVNTAGLQASRADNIGFAIPSTLVERVVPALVENGSYDHSNLGVSVRPVTPQLASANDLDTMEGVYVHQARAGSPAADVLQGTTEITVVDESRVPVGGDVIVAIDDRQVNTTKDLGAYLFTETRPGDTVTLTVVRDGERQQVEVTLGEWPEPDAA